MQINMKYNDILYNTIYNTPNETLQITVLIYIFDQQRYKITEIKKFLKLNIMDYHK